MKNKLLYLLLVIVPIGFSSCDDDEKPKLIPIVTTAVSSDITFSSATVGGLVENDGNAIVTETGIVYSSNVTEPTTADNKLILTSIDGSFSGILEGLTSGTKYHVRAYATNEIGTGYGEVLDFTTGNMAPELNDVMITGEVAVNKEVTASYTYSDAENDEEGATTFQWYIADDATGTGEIAIDGATEPTLLILDAQEGKYIRVSVTPKAATGTIDGMEIKSAYSEVGAETVIFTYNGEVVTYGTITSTTTGEKWLDRNLGAGRVAQSIDDFQAYGDLFQWGRTADGHQLMTRTGPNDADALGVTGITSTTEPYETSTTDAPSTDKFIIFGGSGARDWRDPQNNSLWQGVNGTNNPCPTGWRMPTIDEWTAENLTSGNDAFEKLRLTYSGQRDKSTGNVAFSTYGTYWTSTSRESATVGRYYSVYVGFDATIIYNDLTYRAFGQACRCIKD